MNVTARIPCIVKAQEHNVGYLATKQVGKVPSSYPLSHIGLGSVQRAACACMRARGLHSAAWALACCRVHSMLAEQIFMCRMCRAWRGRKLQGCWAGVMRACVPKQARMAHWMDDGEEGTLDGSFCHWNHDGEPLQPFSLAKRLPVQAPNGKLISRSPS